MRPYRTIISGSGKVTVTFSSEPSPFLKDMFLRKGFVRDGLVFTGQVSAENEFFCRVIRT